MSTLSELIPSGGTQNNIEFVAQGTLANGQTVALRSDGKVEAVTQTSVTGSLGTGVEFEAAGTRDLAAAYSVEDNKYLVIYTDQGDSNKLKAVVGTPSGTNTLSFGTPVAVSSNPNQYQASKGCSYDATAKKIVVSFSDAGNNQYLTTFVATISGTSVSFGAATILNSATSNYVHSFYHAGAGKTCVVASLLSSGLLRTCTVGSTAITSSTAANFSSSQTEYTASCYESKNALGVIYFHRSSTDYPMVRGFTLSGETATFGTEDTLVSEKAGTSSIVYDVKNDYACIIMNYITGSSAVNTCQSIGVRFSSNGSVASKTSVTQVFAANANTGANAIAYDTAGESVYASFYNSSTQIVNQMAFSSNAYTVGTAITWSGSGSTNYPPALAFNSNNFTLGGFYRFGSSSGRGAAYIVPRLSTNASSFIGITNAAISSSATGEVAVKGGLSTGGNLLPYAPVATSKVVVESTSGSWNSAVFDSNSNKIAISYSSDNTSGRCAIGTVSGSSVSFGTPVEFSSSRVTWVSSAFDSSNNKIVIVYRDYGNNGYGTAIVGTISGSSISFGTAVTFASTVTNYSNAVFDSSNNKIVITYEDASNSYPGKAVVGTVSGTSISFGATATFDSNLLYNATSTFDSSNNKVVVAYEDTNNSSYFYAIVGTVSGTSISFGSKVLFNGVTSSGSQNIKCAFDSNAQKVVIIYQESTNGPSAAIVGTVSGTSISFGSKSTVGTTGHSTYQAICFDSNLNQVVFSYLDNTNSLGRVAMGTVSGTSISVGNPITINSANISYVNSVFDSTANKTVQFFRDASSSPYPTTGMVIDVTNTLTIGSTYYVQDNGTLATTSSSTKAGKAISTTALNLVDPT